MSPTASTRRLTLYKATVIESADSIRSTLTSKAASLTLLHASPGRRLRLMQNMQLRSLPTGIGGCALGATTQAPGLAPLKISRPLLLAQLRLDEAVVAVARAALVAEAGSNSSSSSILLHRTLPSHRPRPTGNSLLHWVPLRTLRVCWQIWPNL